MLLIYPGSSFFHPGWYLNAYIIALCVIALLVKLHCDKLLYVWIFIGLFINFAFGALAFTWLDNANATFLGIEYSKISLILNRNFYTIALPFIAMGLFVRRNQKHLARMAASKYMYVAVVLLLVAGVAEHMWQKSIKFGSIQHTLIHAACSHVTLPVRSSTLQSEPMAERRKLWSALLGKHILLAPFGKLHYTGIIATTIGSNIL